MKPEISSFRDKYFFLSNMFRIPVPVNFGGISFFATENAYVAAKTTNYFLRRAISEMEPRKSKEFGKIIFEKKLWVNPDWNNAYRIVLMKELVTQKFSKNIHLKLSLLDTGDTYLKEGNDWHDNFFGVCTCENCSSLEKFNHLGKIHMEVRSELR